MIKPQRWMAILWPAFLMAGVLEMVVFGKRLGTPS